MNDLTRRHCADPARAIQQRDIKSGDIQSGAVTAGAIKSRTDKRRRAAQTSPRLESHDRDSMIAEAAYFRASQRGFEPGHEVEDWLAAEVEIDGALSRGDPPQFCG